MGTFYGGIANVPLAALVMVCEVAGSYDLLVPLMLAEGVAIIALRRVNLYETQPRDDAGLAGPRGLARTLAVPRRPRSEASRGHGLSAARRSSTWPNAFDDAPDQDVFPGRRRRRGRRPALGRGDARGHVRAVTRPTAMIVADVMASRRCSATPTGSARPRTRSCGAPPRRAGARRHRQDCSACSTSTTSSGRRWRCPRHLGSRARGCEGARGRDRDRLLDDRQRRLGDVHRLVVDDGRQRVERGPHAVDRVRQTSVVLDSRASTSAIGGGLFTSAIPGGSSDHLAGVGKLNVRLVVGRASRSYADVDEHLAAVVSSQFVTRGIRDRSRRSKRGPARRSTSTATSSTVGGSRCKLRRLTRPASC